MFIRCLEAAIQVPRVYPTHKVLRARFISSVHRMVECLTTSLLPYLPSALEVLVTTQVDAPDLGEVMALINQLILRWGPLQMGPQGGGGLGIGSQLLASYFQLYRAVMPELQIFLQVWASCDALSYKKQCCNPIPYKSLHGTW